MSFHQAIPGELKLFFRCPYTVLRVAAHLDRYARIVAERAALRELIQMVTQARRRVGPMFVLFLLLQRLPKKGFGLTGLRG